MSDSDIMYYLWHMINLMDAPLESKVQLFLRWYRIVMVSRWMTRMETAGTSFVDMYQTINGWEG